jgi:hypothetical protein
MKSHAEYIPRELRLWLDSPVSGDMVKEQARRFLISLADAMDTKSSRQTLLRPPRVPPTAQVAKGQGSRPLSLALIRTQFSVSHLPYESHVKAEARLAAALVCLLRDTFGVDESIFVATPHRIQRAAVRRALVLSGQSVASGPAPDGDEDEIDNLVDQMAGLSVSQDGNLRVDTVERLQGTPLLSRLPSHCNLNRCRGVVCDLPTFTHAHTVVVQPYRLSSDKAASQRRYQSSEISLHSHFKSRGSQSWH